MTEYRCLMMHKIFVLSVNLLVLVALTIAMYMAAKNPDEFTLEFLKIFGTLLVPLCILGIWGKRRLHRQRESSLVDMV